MMWTILEGLPAEVVGANVLSVLDVNDLARLDTAIAFKGKRMSLTGCFQCVTISQTPWEFRGSKKVAFLQWVAKRGLRLRYWTVENHFCELIPLAESSPNMVENRLRVLCTNQADMDELEAALTNCMDLKFTLELLPKEAVSIHDATKLRMHVTGCVSWCPEFTNTDNLSAVVRGNHSVHDICIDEPTCAAMEITASLGASLQSLSLRGEEMTDDM
jgi:hypothetical protein